MQRGRGLYHHYVPRFILRGFAVSKPSRCFTDDGHGAFIETKLKLNRRNPTYDRMNVYHLEGARLIMASDHTTSGDFTNTVDRNFGLRDLYVDEAHPDSEHIENALSKLESEASKVIKAAIEALDSPETKFRLPRRDLNTLRKFLFVMSYRSSRRGEQFLNNRFDDGTRRDIDKHIKTFLPEGSTARDVWLQNIKEVLDTEYWLIPDNPRIFVHDRAEFTSNMREKHIVFWRATPGREFVTCNNGFGFVDSITVAKRFSPAEVSAISGLMRDMGSEMDANVTDLNHLKGNFPWIRLFPIHPKLCIALVHNMLSLANVIPWLPPSRYHTMPQSQHGIEYVGLSPQAERAWRTGRLQDFMVWQGPAGAITSHAMHLDGRPIESRVDDVFVFPLIPLDAEQTHRVNAMFLENAGNALAFVSPGQLYRSIVHYEASDMWEHKRNYAALKAALRSYSQLTHMSASASASASAATMKPAIVENADRRIVWVCSLPHSPEDPLDARQSVTRIRLARMGLLPPDVPRVGLDDVFGQINRTHMDSLLRNEESELARRKNAERTSPQKARPNPASQASGVPAPTPTSGGNLKKPAKQPETALPQTKSSRTVVPPARPATTTQTSAPGRLPPPAPDVQARNAPPSTPTASATESKPSGRKRNRPRKPNLPMIGGIRAAGSSESAAAQAPSAGPATPRTPVASSPHVASGSARPSMDTASSASSQPGTSTPAGGLPQSGGGGGGRNRRNKRK